MDILLFKSSLVPSGFIKMSKTARATYILAVPRDREQREKGGAQASYFSEGSRGWDGGVS